MTKDEMKSRISMALKDPILQQGFEIICKENAELREKVERYYCLLEKSMDCETCKYCDLSDDRKKEPCKSCFFDSSKWELKE
jgi:hypothetical protein